MRTSPFVVSSLGEGVVVWEQFKLDSNEKLDEGEEEFDTKNATEG